MKHVIIFSGPKGSGRALATRSLVVRGYNSVGFYEPTDLAPLEREEDSAGLLLAEFIHDYEAAEPNSAGGWAITGSGTAEEIEAFVRAPDMLAWNTLLIHLSRPGIENTQPPVPFAHKLPLSVTYMANDSTDEAFTKHVGLAVARWRDALRDEAASYF